jgi:hypothetical protein
MQELWFARLPPSMWLRPSVSTTVCVPRARANAPCGCGWTCVFVVFCPAVPSCRASTLRPSSRLSRPLVSVLGLIRPLFLFGVCVWPCLGPCCVLVCWPQASLSGGATLLHSYLFLRATWQQAVSASWCVSVVVLFVGGIAFLGRCKFSDANSSGPCACVRSTLQGTVVQGCFTAVWQRQSLQQLPRAQTWHSVWHSGSPASRLRAANARETRSAWCLGGVGVFEAMGAAVHLVVVTWAHTCRRGVEGRGLALACSFYGMFAVERTLVHRPAAAAACAAALCAVLSERDCCRGELLISAARAWRAVCTRWAWVFAPGRGVGPGWMCVGCVLLATSHPGPNAPTVAERLQRAHHQMKGRTRVRAGARLAGLDTCLLKKTTCICPCLGAAATLQQLCDDDLM